MGEYRKAGAYYVIMWSQTPLQLLFHLVQIAKPAHFLELNSQESYGQSVFISTKKKKRKDAVLSLRSSMLNRDRRRRVV